MILSDESRVLLENAIRRGYVKREFPFRDADDNWPAPVLSAVDIAKEMAQDAIER